VCAQAVFCYGLRQDQRGQMGLFAIAEHGLALSSRQPGYRAQAQRVCSLLGNTLHFLFHHRPQDLEFVMPRSPRGCEHVASLLTPIFQAICACGAPAMGAAGRLQEPITRLYEMLRENVQGGHFSSGSQREQTTADNAEGE
jgi:hypothetical protein